MYLVKWVGLGYEYCTWETKDDIGNPAIVAEYTRLNNASLDEPEIKEVEVQKVLDDAQHVPEKSVPHRFCDVGRSYMRGALVYDGLPAPACLPPARLAPGRRARGGRARHRQRMPAGLAAC